MSFFRINPIIVFSLMSLFQSLINSDETTICDNPESFGFNKRPGTTEYYYIHDILLTWIDGEYLCQKYGAHLPSVSIQSDLDYLRRELKFLQNFSI